LLSTVISIARALFQNARFGNDIKTLAKLNQLIIKNDAWVNLFKP